MGLDMYLSRTNTHGYPIQKVRIAEDYFDWEAYKATFVPNEKESEPCSFKEWCGHEESEVTKEMLETFRPMYVTRYYAWDNEKRYPHAGLFEPVGYWRKANQIHNWFVQNVQGGVDECDEYEVTKNQLLMLRNACAAVIEKAVLEYGQVHNGDRLVDGKWEPIMERGMIVINPEVCEEMLPSVEGFFFGGTNYDEYYIDDLKHTVSVLDKVLAETDFNTQTITYQSSW